MKWNVLVGDLLIVISIVLAVSGIPNLIEWAREAARPRCEIKGCKNKATHRFALKTQGSNQEPVRMLLCMSCADEERAAIFEEYEGRVTRIVGKERERR